ncbi:MAG: His/Gly/Thr/Pro-type tRNA ligase C-terminal domain-containing protein [Desulfobacterales bacterium]|nr:His/Gly/Thr/Pro-type tRNA ligase C-terminal domain-containing protein [Desulfobacterales bacterium]
MQAPELKKLDAFIVSNNMTEALKLAIELREQGVSVDFDLNNKKFGKQMEKASKIKAKYALILGEDEINSKTVTIKNLDTGKQENVPLDRLLPTLNRGE